MPRLNELEYRIILGARRTRVVVYEHHGEFIPPSSENTAPSKRLPIGYDGTGEPPDESEPMAQLFNQPGYSYYESTFPDLDEMQIKSNPKDIWMHGIFRAMKRYKRRMATRRNKICELVYNNFEPPYTSMLTLTFDSSQKPNLNFRDLDVAHKEFKKFIQRMNFRFDNFKYVATFSRQQNKNWHYHVLCNVGSSTTKEQIETIWGQGHVWISYIFKEHALRDKVEYCINNLNGVGIADLKGEKGYLASKGLQRNIDLRSWVEDEAPTAETYFNQIKGEPHKILFTTKYQKGFVVMTEENEIVRIRKTRLERWVPKDLKELGPWIAETHYISSSAKLKNLFTFLPEAKLKK